LKYPDRYVRDPVNENLEDELPICEGWVLDKKTGETVRCKKKPDWVVHSCLRLVGEDRVCDENFFCDQHFYGKYPRWLNDVLEISFVEFDHWFKRKKGMLL
jgi:hypothetical protein